MQSETARMNSAAEAKFRIREPNSRPRAVKVIALDKASEETLQQVAKSKWDGATFLTASTFAMSAGKFSLDGWLTDLAGKTCDLMREIENSDSVIMVATVGQALELAALIGEACNIRHVLTTGIVLSGKDRDGPELIRALNELRPHVVMLVVTADNNYVEDMLNWLRA